MDKYHQIIKMWQDYDIRTADDLDRYLGSFRVLFAYNSAKIENTEITYNDTREVFEDGRVHNFAGEPRTLFEVQNQKLCYTFLLPKIVEKATLSNQLVKEIHGILTAGTYDEHRFINRGERPGTFKRHDYVTGINEVGSLPEDVEDDMAELIEEVNYADHQNNPEKVLKTAAYLHAGFENIHPFADGNGRVGRTLVNYYLMTHEHPPLIVYEGCRREYYRALQDYDENENLEPLYLFFMSQVLRTWEKTLGRQEKEKK